MTVTFIITTRPTRHSGAVAEPMVDKLSAWPEAREQAIVKKTITKTTTTVTKGKTFKALLRDFLEEAPVQSWAAFAKYLEGKTIDFASDKTSATVLTADFDQSVKFPKGAAKSVAVTLLMEKANAEGVDDTEFARTRKYSGARITGSFVGWY